jgi:hypothetical protein
MKIYDFKKYDIVYLCKLYYQEIFIEKYINQANYVSLINTKRIAIAF